MRCLARAGRGRSASSRAAGALPVCSLSFFTDPAATEIYTLSLHDALPILDRKDRAEEQYRAALAAKPDAPVLWRSQRTDRKSTRLNSSHLGISYAVFCLKKKTNPTMVPLQTRSEHSALNIPVRSRPAHHLD